MRTDKHLTTPRHRGRLLTSTWLALIIAIAIILPPSIAYAQDGDVGYRDFTYPSGAGGDSRVTAEKPESKLWWNDGAWYGCMWSTSGNAYHIFRLNISDQTWVDTNVAIDNRLATLADTLWDGQKLYVASHVFALSGDTPFIEGQQGKLFRYSYNTVNKTYSLDPGFPVVITGRSSETLVIEKDSIGQLWVTYVESNTVMVTHSLINDDLTWVTPYPLPALGNEILDPDDISSIITYDQHVGIMWSNQKTLPITMYFAMHAVDKPDSDWTSVGAYAISGDDHINLKTMQSDPAGNVFAVVKTNSATALIVLLVCKNSLTHCMNKSDWTHYTVYDSYDNNPTRPILMIDETNRDLYVITHNEDPGTGFPRPGGIYYKRSSIDQISFPSGMGTPFIRTALDDQVNDVTSTKQNVNSATGLLVLASNKPTKMYLHNYLPLPGLQPDLTPVIESFSPGSGPADTEVVITGQNLDTVSEVRFNGTLATTLTIDSEHQLRALVPHGGSDGLITITNPAGSDSSATPFVVTSPAIETPPVRIYFSFIQRTGLR